METKFITEFGNCDYCIHNKNGYCDYSKMSIKDAYYFNKCGDNGDNGNNKDKN